MNELLLRLERVRFEPYRLVPEAPTGEDVAGPFDQQSSRNVGRMCDFIAENFLYDIDCVDIAAAADIHPKYAMSVFKKSTGMTLNEYVNLLRLSYAQAMLMHQDANVLTRGHGQRLRLAQRLQQIVPQARRHVALRFSQSRERQIVGAARCCSVPTARQRWQAFDAACQADRKVNLERRTSPKTIIAEHHKERRAMETAP